MVTEQPRASPTSAPSQSLPPTTRPAGTGVLSRAGLPDRLVQLSLTLCLIYDSPLCTGWDRDHQPQGVRNCLISNLAFSEKSDALAKEQANKEIKDLPFPSGSPLPCPSTPTFPWQSGSPLPCPSMPRSSTTYGRKTLLILSSALGPAKCERMDNSREKTNDI